MTAAPTLWSFIAHADMVVKFVLLLLVMASVVSWTIIIQKYRVLRLAKRKNRQFEDFFWSGVDLTAYHQKLGQQAQPPTGMAGVFFSGLQEFTQMPRRKVGQSDAQFASVERAMRSSQARQIEQLTSQTGWLATIGSISPYVGLFGTVWGIMSAFRSLGLVQQASIAMVAPGIAEALIATAVGLLAAIPAVVAYNRFAAIVEGIETQYDNFRDELTNILQRQAPAEADLS